MSDFWNAVLDDLAGKVSSHNFDAWFSKLNLHHVGEQTAFLEVSDDFFKAWIESNYIDVIEDSVETIAGSRWNVVIEVAGQYEPADASPHDIRVDRPAAAARDSRRVQEQVRAVEPSLAERVSRAGLNPRYTFDEFVVGGSNQFVHAACSAVATNPSRTYNPLFVFGGVGLGKTHLLQAIGIEALQRNPRTRIVYLSSEEFMNRLINSLRHKEMDAFRSSFRRECDLLLIDDVQFIGGKDSTQEEFFHTFNALYHSGKQIVMTSDKPPKELPGIEERLASRFAWGLTADIQPPEMETRVAILEKKAEADGVRLAKEVAILIASCVRSNVRELEGTLIRIGAQAKLIGTPMTIDFVRDMLKRMNLEAGRRITPERIMKLVANHFDLKISDLKGSSRAHSISRPRQIAMYLSRKHTDLSYPEIGRAFDKDHTTVLAACRKLEKLEGSKDALAVAVGELESILLR